MFCSKCGAQIPDNVKFCPKCGAPITQMESAPEETPSDSSGGGTEHPVKSGASNKGKPPKFVIPLIIVVVIVVVVVIAAVAIHSHRAAEEETVSEEDVLEEEDDTDSVQGAEIDYYISPDGQKHYTDVMEVDEDEPDTEIDSGENEYTEEEQQEMMQRIAEIDEEIAEERGDLPNGYVSISLNVPTDWEGSDISVTICNITYKEIKETVVLKKDLNWKDSFEIPIGEYSFWKAETDSGDSFQCDKGIFEITEDETTYITLYTDE